MTHCNAKDINWLYRQPEKPQEAKQLVLRAYLRDTALVIECGAQSCTVDLEPLFLRIQAQRRGRMKKTSDG